jgi:iron complex outermembrane recepter protein
MSNSSLRVAIAAILAGSTGTATQVVFAQGGALEEIVVTATRRAQDLQEVPVSIVALSGDSLELQGLDSLEDVGNYIPNINIQGGGGGTSQPQFRVRGLPNVGVFIDGIWQVGTAGFLTQDFVDVDRIEVLRGPQGTTYGRDAVGGAIRIWTRQPGEEFGANVSATVGSFDRRDVKMSVDVPITDNFLTKWTGASLSRDGYIQGLEVNRKFGASDQTQFRGDMLFTPSDNLSFRLNYSVNDLEMTEPRIQDAIFDTSQTAFQSWGVQPARYYGLAIEGATARGGAAEVAGLDPYEPEYMQAGFPGGRVGEWENRSNTMLPTTIGHEQLALDVNWDVTDSISVQFLTALTEQRVDSFVDWDNSPYTLVEDLNRSKLELFSEEIQISGGGDRVNWVVGLYYWDQQSVARNARFYIDEFRTLPGNAGPQLQFDDVFASQRCMNLLDDTVNPLANSGPVTIPGNVTIDETDPRYPRQLATCQRNVYDSFNAYQYDQHNFNDQDGFAVFAETTIALTDTLDLTLGVRHHDQTNESGPMIAAANRAPRPATTNMLHTGGDPFAGSRGNAQTVEFDEVTMKVALQKQFTDDIMGYVSYSEGFDSGGISTVTQGTTQLRFPYTPQIIENSEIGIRADLANGRVRLNATYFDSDWLNIQNVGVVRDANGNELPQLVTTNVGRANASGLELELTVLPTDSLTLNLNVGILDTEYVDIAQGTFALDETTEFAQAPDLTYNIGIQHVAGLANGGAITTRVDYAYTDQFWRSLPFLRMDWYGPQFGGPVPPGYDESGDWGVVNARIGYQPPDADWSVALFGTNLTNEYMLNSGFFHGIWGYNFATVSRPREAGLTFNFNF